VTIILRVRRRPTALRLSTSLLNSCLRQPARRTSNRCCNRSNLPRNAVVREDTAIVCSGTRTQRTIDEVGCVGNNHVGNTSEAQTLRELSFGVAPYQYRR